MAEFQWWLLIVGLVAGGGLVAVVMLEGRRREEDVTELERRAEATWISERLRGPRASIDPRTVEAVLRAHREYLSLPPPDELVVQGEAGAPAPADRAPVPPVTGSEAREELGQADPDDAPDQVRDDRRRSADEDLART